MSGKTVFGEVPSSPQPPQDAPQQDAAVQEASPPSPEKKWYEDSDCCDFSDEDDAFIEETVPYHVDQADDYDPQQDRYQISHKDVNRFQPDQGDMLLLTPSQGQRIPSVKQINRLVVSGHPPVRDRRLSAYKP